MGFTFPAVDFPLYGLPADVEMPRRLDQVEGRLGEPSFGLWLWHGDAGGPTTRTPWLRVGSLPQERHASLMTPRGGDPVREVAWVATFALLNATMPATSDQPTGYLEDVGEFFQGRADGYAGWPEVTWRVDGRELPARVLAWAGAWTGFTCSAADVGLVAVGYGFAPESVELVLLEDTAAYHFDHRSPLVVPDDLDRGWDATVGAGEVDAEAGWPLHPDHREVSAR